MKITIFGMAGTGTSSTGKTLAKDLGYQFASGGDMARKVSAELNIPLGELEELSKVDKKYDLMRDECLRKFGQTYSDCIVEARLGWWAVPDSFKIKLVCDDKTRIGRIMAREDKSYDQVIKETFERENSIRHRFEQYYNMDFDKETEDSKFDLVIDTCKNNLEQVVSLIKEKVEERQPSSLHRESAGESKKDGRIKNAMFSFLKAIFFILIMVSSSIIAYDYWRENISKTPLVDADKKIREIIEIPEIKISNPSEWEVIDSPLKITGEAEGTWFVDAEFQILLLDQTGKILSKTTAYTKEDWTSGDMVAFQAIMEFGFPLPDKGFVVFVRENPEGGGVPQEFRVPVLFQ